MEFVRSSFSVSRPATRYSLPWSSMSAMKDAAATSSSLAAKRRITIACESDLSSALTNETSTLTMSTTSFSCPTERTETRSFSIDHASDIYQRELRRSLEEYRPEPEDEDDDDSVDSAIIAQLDNHNKNKTLQRSASTVRFAEKLEIRKYPLQLGDNPSCTVSKNGSGPPLTLGWNCVEVEIKGVHDPDSSWYPQQRPRRRTRQEREDLLLKAGNGRVSRSDIRKSVQEVCKIQKQRQQSRQETSLVSVIRLYMERSSSKLCNLASLGERKRQERAYLKRCGVVVFGRRRRRQADKQAKKVPAEV